MKDKLEEHFSDSGLYRRPNTPYFEYISKRGHISLQSQMFYPVFLTSSVSYTKKDISKRQYDKSFCPKFPLSFEINSDMIYSLTANFSISNEKIPKLLSNMKFSTSIHGQGFDNVSFVSSLNSMDRFYSSIAFNPLIISSSYYWKAFGIEITYGFTDEQPAFAVLYHKKIGSTKVTAMGSIYGAITSLVSTKFQYFTAYSLFDSNLFTLQSSSSFGIRFPYKMMNASIAFKLPEQKLSFELSIETNKSIASLYLPIGN